MEQFPLGGNSSGQNLGFSDITQLTPDDILLLKNIYPEITMTTNDGAFYEQSIGNVMSMLGGEESTTTTLNYHYETGSYFAPAYVASVSGASASAITLVYTTASVAGSSGSYVSPGQVNDIVMINGRYQCVVTAKAESTTDNTTHSITINRGSDTSFALNNTAVVNNGAILTFPYSVQHPASAFPDGIRITDTRYETGLMLMETATSEVLSDLANQETYINLPGNPSTKFQIARQDVALTLRHALKRSIAFLTGNGSTYTIATQKGNQSVTATQGLYPTIQKFGTVRPITPGLMDLNDIYDVVTFARSTGQTKEVMGLFGTERKIEWDRIFATNFNNGAVIYAANFDSFGKKEAGTGSVSLTGDTKKEFAVSLGFQSVNVLDTTVHAKAVSEFDHPTIFNVPGLQKSWYRQTAAFLPMQASSSFNGVAVAGTTFKMLYRLGINGNQGFNNPAKSRIRVVDQGPSNLDLEGWKKTFIEEFGLQTKNASKMQLITL